MQKYTKMSMAMTNNPTITHPNGNRRKMQDSLTRLFVSSRKHNSILRSLNHAIHTHGLTHRFLRRVMEAREADLEVMQYARVGAWDASINTQDINTIDEVASSQEALRKATHEMANMAFFHLHRACENQSSVPKEGRPCLLPAVCGLQYLD